MALRRRPRVIGLGFAMALGGLVCGPTQAAACDASSGANAAACAPQISTLLSAPAQARDLERAEAQLSGRPWISPVWTATPFALTGQDDGFEVRASLHQAARHARAKADARARGLLAAGSANLALPPLVLDSPKYDVWAKMGVGGFSGDAQDRRLGAVGADMKLSRRSVVGISLDTETSEIARRRFGGYFASRLAPGLMLRGGAYVGADALDFGDDRVRASARDADLNLSWTVPLAQFALKPTASLAYRGRDVVHEGERSYVSASAVTLAPRLSRSFETSGGLTLEPYVGFEKVFELGDDTDAGSAAFTANEALSAGFGLKTDDALSVDLSTRLERADEDGAPNIGGRLQFRVPLD